MIRILLVCWVFLAGIVFASAQVLTPQPSPVMSVVADAYPVVSAVVGQPVEVGFLVGLKGLYTRNFYDLPIGVRPLDNRIRCDYRVGRCTVTSATPGPMSLFVTPLGGDKDIPFYGSRVTINFVPEPRVGAVLPLTVSTTQGEVGDVIRVDLVVPTNLPGHVVLEVLGGETFSFPGGLSFGQRVRVREEVVTPFSLPGTGVVEVRLTSSHSGEMRGVVAYNVRTNPRPEPTAEMSSGQIRVQGLPASGLYLLALVRGPRFFIPLGEARNIGGELFWDFGQLGYQVELPEGFYTLLLTHEQGESHTVRLHLP